MVRTYLDTRNTLKQQAIVGGFSLILVWMFYYLLETSWSVAFARVSFVLLFLTLIIGPIARLRKPAKVFNPLKLPWTWRGELGIWFAITALVHFFLVMSGRPEWSLKTVLGGFISGGGYGFSNFIGLIALVLAIILALTSSSKVIMFLGIESWKWLQGFAYVIFYLVFVHTVYFQFFSTYGGGPDWFGYSVLVMAIVIVVLQICGFVKTIFENH